MLICSILSDLRTSEKHRSERHSREGHSTAIRTTSTQHCWRKAQITHSPRQQLGQTAPAQAGGIPTRHSQHTGSTANPRPHSGQVHFAPPGYSPRRREAAIPLRARTFGSSPRKLQTGGRTAGRNEVPAIGAGRRSLPPSQRALASRPPTRPARGARPGPRSPTHGARPRHGTARHRTRGGAAHRQPPHREGRAEPL